MLIPSYFPLVGGAEVQLSGLLKKLDHEKIDPFILTRRVRGTPPVEKNGKTTIIRKRAPFRPTSFFISSLLYLLRRRQHFDIVHVHSFDSPAFAGAIVKLRYPEKRLILRLPRFSDGSAFIRQQKSFFGRKRLNFVLKKADAVILLCDDSVEALRASGFPDEKIAHFPNGVDSETFCPASDEEKKRFREAMGITEGAFVGVFTGRLIPRKNVAAALESWRGIVDTHPRSVLLIAGTGPEELRLKAFASEHLPTGSVIFFGAASREAIPKILKASDVYVSFSTSEGMSNAMLEALSTGLPVVASRGPGIDSLVRNGETGFLVDPSTPKDAVFHLRRLCEEPATLQKMAGAARRLAAAEYSFDRVAKCIEALYFDEDVPKALRASPPPAPQPDEEPLEEILPV